MKSLKERYGDDGDAAKVYYNKLLCHHAEVSLTKDEKSKNLHPGFTAFEDLSARYAKQVCA